MYRFLYLSAILALVAVVVGECKESVITVTTRTTRTTFVNTATTFAVRTSTRYFFLPTSTKSVNAATVKTSTKTLTYTAPARFVYLSTATRVSSTATVTKTCPCVPLTVTKTLSFVYQYGATTRTFASTTTLRSTLKTVPSGIRATVLTQSGSSIKSGTNTVSGPATQRTSTRSYNQGKTTTKPTTTIKTITSGTSTLASTTTTLIVSPTATTTVTLFSLQLAAADSEYLGNTAGLVGYNRSLSFRPQRSQAWAFYIEPGTTHLVEVSTGRHLYTSCTEPGCASPDKVRFIPAANDTSGAYCTAVCGQRLDCFWENAFPIVKGPFGAYFSALYDDVDYTGPRLYVQGLTKGFSR